MPKASLAKSESRYGVHPSVAMVQKSMAELKEKTGRALEEWIALVKKEGPKHETSRREWLETKHNVGTRDAGWIAERAEGKGGDEDTPELYLKAAVRYVEAQYAGPKGKLRPIYDELLTLGKSMGSDAKACPCKTMVPLYRNHVFAQIKPTTNSRIDLGFALTHHKGKLEGLIDTGGLAKKDRITHRMEITAVEQIDGEVKKWLKTAYDLDT
jgi:hypothetical protein